MQSEQKPELPDPNTKRWTVRRKAAVVQALRIGSLSAQEVYELYRISGEELHAWERDFDQYGLRGLRARQRHILQRKTKRR